MEKLIGALGPAFATGFAVQRLLEILDPITPARLRPERKKSILGIISLICGFAAAYWLKETRVLSLLGIQNVEILDFVVTGLIISAGTEGFNSILKFLSYKKEETKAAAVTEKIDAARALRAPSALGLDNLNLSPEAVGNDTMEDAMTLEEELEKSLIAEIKKRWSSLFVPATWKKQPFSDYTQDEGDPKVVVLHATQPVAIKFGLPLSNASIIKMQSEVGLATKGKEALESMRKALV